MKAKTQTLRPSSGDRGLLAAAGALSVALSGALGFTTGRLTAPVKTGASRIAASAVPASTAPTPPVGTALAVEDGSPAPGEVLGRLAVAARASSAAPSESLMTEVHGSPALGPRGKATLLYVGAEYCPFCAATRWALVVALDRFGTLSGLRLMTSSATDYAPNTPTFTFAGATYRSRYVSLRAVELTTNQPSSQGAFGYVPLETPTRAEDAVWKKYDPQGSIPFLALGRGAVSQTDIGAPYSPLLLAGLSWQTISRGVEEAAQGKPGAPAYGTDILTAANAFTQAICKEDGGEPQAVCR